MGDAVLRLNPFCFHCSLNLCGELCLAHPKTGTSPLLSFVRIMAEELPINSLRLHYAGSLAQPDNDFHDAACGQHVEPVRQGQRVFTAGHSFHVFVAPLLADIARSAGIAGHVNLGAQFLGGSRVIEHWERPESLNQAKRVLCTGRADVLTLSPTFHPDPGIDRFVRLALEHNPAIRVTVQQSWVPFDNLLYAQFQPAKASRDALTGDDLRELHAAYFQSIIDEVDVLNRSYGKPVLSVVPVGQALIALRERIKAGGVPGVRSQEALFTDALGHPALPVQVLAAYAHFALIYRRNPVGLPFLPKLGLLDSQQEDEMLNRLLQELAWETVLNHPLSGVGHELTSRASA